MQNNGPINYVWPPGPANEVIYTATLYRRRTQLQIVPIDNFSDYKKKVPHQVCLYLFSQYNSAPV